MTIPCPPKAAGMPPNKLVQMVYYLFTTRRIAGLQRICLAIRRPARHNQRKTPGQTRRVAGLHEYTDPPLQSGAFLQSGAIWRDKRGLGSYTRRVEKKRRNPCAIKSNLLHLCAGFGRIWISHFEP